jgi:hypothetical protein
VIAASAITVRGNAKNSRMNKTMPNFRVVSKSRHRKVITVNVMNSMRDSIWVKNQVKI